MLSKFVGVGVDWLKRRRLIVKLAHMLRFRHPVLWGAIMRRLKPYYLTYRASLEERRQESLQVVDNFNDQNWRRKQSLNHFYGCSPISYGIPNKSPSVDPNELLKRINKNLNI